MAKKKGKKTTKRRSTRRRGGIRGFGSGNELMQGGLVIAGGLGSRVLGNATSKIKVFQGEHGPKIRAAAKGLVAAALLYQRDQTLKQLGYGVLVETAFDIAGQVAPDQFGGQSLAGIGATVIDLDEVGAINRNDYGVAGTMTQNDLAVAGVV